MSVMGMYCQLEDSWLLELAVALAFHQLVPASNQGQNVLLRWFQMYAVPPQSAIVGS